jgi:class 3 adenylate cyclase
MATSSASASASTLGRIGFEGRYDYAAIGPVANLASRLCDEARDAEILVSQRVLTAVGQLVETEPAGDLVLKGFVRPVAAYRVLRLTEE